jgi:hypothetical protein
VIFTIFVVSLLIYYLYYQPVILGDGNNTIDVELKESSNPSYKRSDNYYKNIKRYRYPTIEEPLKDNSAPIKDYMTLEDIKKKTKEIKKEESHPSSFNEEIFRQVKSILEASSDTVYQKKRIVLNSRISSLLISHDAKESFKSMLMRDFGYDYQTINEEFKKNRTVWDWVIFLSP